MLISFPAHCVADFGHPLLDARTPCDLLFLGIISFPLLSFVRSAHSQAVKDEQGTCHVARFEGAGFALHATGKKSLPMVIRYRPCLQ